MVCNERDESLGTLADYLSPARWLRKHRVHGYVGAAHGYASSANSYARAAHGHTRTADRHTCSVHDDGHVHSNRAPTQTQSSSSHTNAPVH
jgi:hypothetical protein